MGTLKKCQEVTNIMNLSGGEGLVIRIHTLISPGTLSQLRIIIIHPLSQHVLLSTRPTR